MKDKIIIFITIWLVICLIGLVVCYFMGGVTTGSYYNGLINCGICTKLSKTFWTVPIIPFTSASPSSLQ